MGANDLDGNSAALSKYMRLCDAACQISAKERDEARDDLLDSRLTGPRLWESLESWLNVEGREYQERLGTLAYHLQGMFNGHKEDRDVPWADRLATARYEAEQWLTGIVKESISEDEVLARAEHIAADREEG